ncbi:hypothetical protein BJY04DRAFT_219052 [Aspergillus karnatakaensis]|uniref:uncharacterized protein n=1 Tax=Aspergillus karnatakaensis TaxID=1810916 RepID=UPI003CCCED96
MSNVSTGRMDDLFTSRLQSPSAVTAPASEQQRNSQENPTSVSGSPLLAVTDLVLQESGDSDKGSYTSPAASAVVTALTAQDHRTPDAISPPPATGPAQQNSPTPSLSPEPTRTRTSKRQADLQISQPFRQFKRPHLTHDISPLLRFALGSGPYLQYNKEDIRAASELYKRHHNQNIQYYQPQMASSQLSRPAGVTKARKSRGPAPYASMVLTGQMSSQAGGHQQMSPGFSPAVPRQHPSQPQAQHYTPPQIRRHVPPTVRQRMPRQGSQATSGPYPAQRPQAPQQRAPLYQASTPTLLTSHPQQAYPQGPVYQAVQANVQIPPQAFQPVLKPTQQNPNLQGHGETSGLLLTQPLPAQPASAPTPTPQPTQALSQIPVYDPSSSSVPSSDPFAQERAYFNEHIFPNIIPADQLQQTHEKYFRGYENADIDKIIAEAEAEMQRGLVVPPLPYINKEMNMDINMDAEFGNF